MPAEHSRESGRVAMKAAGWLVNDHSAQAAHWYISAPVSGEQSLVANAPWVLKGFIPAPVSGEQSLVVPRRPHEEISDVSANSRLIVSLRDPTIKTQRLWEAVTSPPAPARTRLGKRLLELRDKFRASGERLLDWDEIAREIQERRGQRDMGDME